MVYLLNIGFENYDIIFNTNLDDYYMYNRFEKQLECLNNGYTLCSSIMNYILKIKRQIMIMLQWNGLHKDME